MIDWTGLDGKPLTPIEAKLVLVHRAKYKQLGHDRLTELERKAIDAKRQSLRDRIAECAPQSAVKVQVVNGVYTQAEYVTHLRIELDGLQKPR